MVLRCNLVSIDKDNTLVSFNGQGLSAESMAEAAKACDEFWQGIEFMHLSMYRNLLILDKDRGFWTIVLFLRLTRVWERMLTCF